MTGRKFVKRVALIAVLLLGLGWAFIQWQNVALVHDPYDQVQTATLGTLTVNHPSKEMSSLPFNWFAAIIETDSQFEIECRNGKILEGGYMTVMSGGTVEITEDCEFENWER